MSGIIRWEDPPDRRGQAHYDWPAIAGALQGRPGAWALALVCPTREIAATTARYVRESHYEALQGEQYDAKARTVDGEFRVYARYLGPRHADPAGGPA